MNNTSLPIPHQRDAEAALLGSVFIHPDVFLEVSDTLQAEDFYLQRHRWIWEAFNSLQDRHSPLDFITLCDELERSGKLQEVGGPAYLTGLINEVPTALHASEYARIISEHAVRRRMLAAANMLAKNAYREDIGLDQALNEAETAVLSLSSSSDHRALVPASAVVDQLYDRMASQAAASILPTGFLNLDLLLSGGLRRSDLAVVAGRPGMGKTGFLLSLIRQAAIIQGQHRGAFQPGNG